MNIEDRALEEVYTARSKGVADMSIIAAALISIAISQKRQADSMDRLEKQELPLTFNQLFPPVNPHD
jgi:hypothetical protein